MIKVDLPGAVLSKCIRYKICTFSTDKRVTPDKIAKVVTLRLQYHHFICQGITLQVFYLQATYLFGSNTRGMKYLMQIESTSARTFLLPLLTLYHYQTIYPQVNIFSRGAKNWCGVFGGVSALQETLEQESSKLSKVVCIDILLLITSKRTCNCAFCCHLKIKQ